MQNTEIDLIITEIKKEYYNKGYADGMKDAANKNLELLYNTISKDYRGE